MVFIISLRLFKSDFESQANQGLLCELKIPNQEVKNLYQQIIERWLSNGYGIEWYNHFLNELLEGNIEGFERNLQKLMEHTLSSHDMARDSEAFYHGLLMGFTASLSGHKNYELESNQEKRLWQI